MKEGKLLAINEEKTDKLLRSIKKSYRKENTTIGFDNAYSIFHEQCQNGCFIRMSNASTKILSMVSETGKNIKPRLWDKDTGLNRNPKKRRKRGGENDE